MAPGQRIQKVVAEYPGSNTGDRIVVTEDGTRWEVVDVLPVHSTGNRGGILCGEQVKEF